MGGNLVVVAVEMAEMGVVHRAVEAAMATEAPAVLVGGSPGPGTPAPPAQRSSPSEFDPVTEASLLFLDAHRMKQCQHCPSLRAPPTVLRTCMHQLPAAQPHRSPTPRSPIRSEYCSSRCGHTPPPHSPPTSLAASPTATHPAGRARTGRC